MACSAVVRSLVLVLLVIPNRVDSAISLRASTTQSHPMEGHSTALTCDVEHMNDSQIITWNKDQMFLTWGDTMGQMMSSRFELSLDEGRNNVTTYTLKINDVTRDDDGRYQCQVLQGNGAGYLAVASESVFLSVLYFPASDYPQCSLSGAMTLLTETELSVSCMTEVGNPQISAMWMTDYPSAPLPVYHMDALSNMVFAELDLHTTLDHDGADYVCIVSSPAYPSLSRNCTLGPLRVIEWPIVTVTRSVPRVSEGSNIHFSCHTEPRMPEMRWVTYPSISRDRLVLTGNGSVLTVTNVGARDNSTYVVCQVPYRDTLEEAGSLIVLEESTFEQPWIDPVLPSGHATSQLCVPWFGAFIFTAVINVILCIIITRLLLKIRRLSSKQKSEQLPSRTGSSGNAENRQKKNNGIVLTWPATSTNWTISDKMLRDERRESWRSHRSHNGDEPLKGDATAYMALTPNSADKEKNETRSNQPHYAASLPRLDKGDKAYVIPNSRTQHERGNKVASKTGAQSAMKSSSKPSEQSKKGTIETVSGAIPMQPPSQAGSSSYMDLHAKSKVPGTAKLTHQARQTKGNSSRSATKSVPVKKSVKASKDEMADESGIYDTGGSYMGLTGISNPVTKRGSMMDESASYTPVGTVISSKIKPAKINHLRQGTTSSKSSSESYDMPYEITPVSPGANDDGMGDGIYGKSPSTAGGGKNLKHGSSRGTVSSRAPLPEPRAPKHAKRQDIEVPTTSTDESYSGPYSEKQKKNQVYFTLEPDTYTNYGADISSECDSYHGGGETVDWDKSTASGSKSAPRDRKISTATEASYVSLEDVEGEVKGYMIMKKAPPDQPKAPVRFSKKPRNISSDSDCSSTEYYEQMADGKHSYQYAVPPCNQLAPVKEPNSVIGADGDTNVQGDSNPKTGFSEERKQKKKGGWGIFRK